MRHSYEYMGFTITESYGYWYIYGFVRRFDTSDEAEEYIRNFKG